MSTIVDGTDRRTYTVQVGGMTCAACAGRVARTLTKLDGVDATVNYATEQAHVVCEDDVDPRMLIDAIERAGYEARRIDDSSATGEIDDALARRSRDLRRRLVVAAMLAVPLADLSLALSIFPELRFPGWTWVCLALAAPLVGWCAWPFHAAAWRGLRHRTATMDTLISIGVLAATGWTLAVMFRGGPVEPGLGAGWSALTRAGDALYLDVVAIVVAFLLAGRFFEAQSKQRAASAMRALLDRSAVDVEVVRGDTVLQLPADRLLVGDLVTVRPGQTIPADAVVVEGRAAVDTSAVTGESVPRDVRPGDAVVGGTRDVDGLLVVRTTRVGADSRLARMARLIERAQTTTANAQRLADRVCAVFVPAVLVLAAVTFAAWLLAGHPVGTAVSTAVAVLIVACPCALGLATPTAILAGTGRGAQLGLFLKGAPALEATRSVDTVVFDKTGTLTEGRMQVGDVVAVEPGGEGALLRLAGAVEHGSEHPIGVAIAAAASTDARVTDFTAVPGVGVSGLVEGRRVVVGRATGTPLPAGLAARRDALEATGATVVAVDVDGATVGIVALTDRPRPDAAAAVTTLRTLGLTPLMLTGDNARTAVAVAAEVGIDPAREVTAEASPEDKVAVVRRLQQEGHRVAFVGDGINDAAALAAADLGIAVGRGTDAAVDAADIVLGRDDLTAVAAAVELARRTHRTIRWNLLWAFAYNTAALPLAAFGLLTPLVAGAAMALSSVFVVTHSLALGRFRPPPTTASREP